MPHLTQKYTAALLLSSCIVSTSIPVLANDTLRWSGTVYDFGVINEDDGMVAHRFVFENTSAEPVSIISAGARCNCTSTLYDTRAIAAGDTASVIVRFNPTMRPGAFNQRVAVRMTTSSTPYYLFVKGEVNPSLKRLSKEFPYGKSALRFATDAITITQPTGIYTFSIPAVNIGNDILTPYLGTLPTGVKATVTPQQVPTSARVSIVLECDINALRQCGVNERAITIYDSTKEPRIATVLPIILTNN